MKLREALGLEPSDAITVEQPAGAPGLSASRTAASSSESSTSVLTAYTNLQRQILEIQANA